VNHANHARVFIVGATRRLPELPDEVNPMRRFDSRITFASGAVAFGALACGALAIGAMAIGSIAIKRASVLDARLQSLVVNELSVGRLRVDRLSVTDSLELPVVHDELT
jgi:hypothetical protein